MAIDGQEIPLVIDGQEIPWFRWLYYGLLDYKGYDCYGDVLLPWIPKAQEAVSHLSEFRQFFLPSARTDDFQFSLWNLYALSRVNDYLLVPFQLGGKAKRKGIYIAPDQYVSFFEEIGFSVFRDMQFTPFRHEIVEVLASDTPDDPVEVLEHVWPGLMLGNMVFSRSGVRVCAGRNHVAKEVAERSTMYFTYHRPHRKATDLSEGWGSNSQWRTDFRRDYEYDGFFLYNADGEIDLTSDSQFTVDHNELSVRQRLELCKNRCLIVSKREDSDLWPYRYRYCESQDSPTEINAQWLTWNDGTVRRIAESIRLNHAYNYLPILADALEEAGCLDRTLLKHCRESGSHGPRCWAVEILLDKE